MCSRVNLEVGLCGVIPVMCAVRVGSCDSISGLLGRGIEQTDS